MEYEDIQEILESDDLAAGTGGNYETMSGTVKVVDKRNMVHTIEVKDFGYYRFGRGDDDISAPARFLKEYLNTEKIMSQYDLDRFVLLARRQTGIDLVNAAASVPMGDLFRSRGFQPVDNVLVAVSPNVPVELTPTGLLDPNTLHAFWDPRGERIWFNTYAAQKNLMRLDADGDRVQLVIDKKNNVAYVIKHPVLRPGTKVILHDAQAEGWHPIKALRDVTFSSKDISWGKVGNLDDVILSRLEMPPVGEAYNRGMTKQIYDKVHRGQRINRETGKPALRALWDSPGRAALDSEGHARITADFYETLKFRYQKIIERAIPNAKHNQTLVDQMFHASLLRKDPGLFEAVETGALAAMRKGKIVRSRHKILDFRKKYAPIYELFTSKRNRVTELDEKTLALIDRLVIEDPDNLANVIRQTKMGVNLDKIEFVDTNPYFRRVTKGSKIIGADVGQKGLFARLQKAGIAELDEIWGDESALPEMLRGRSDISHMAAVKFKINGRYIDLDRTPQKRTPILGRNLLYEDGKFRFMSPQEVMDDILKHLDFRVYDGRAGRRFAGLGGNLTRKNLLSEFGEPHLIKMAEVLDMPTGQLRDIIKLDVSGTKLQQLVAKFDWLNPENEWMVKKIVNTIMNKETRGRHGRLLPMSVENLPANLRDIPGASDVDEIARKYMTGQVFINFGRETPPEEALTLLKQASKQFSTSTVPGKTYNNQYAATLFQHDPNNPMTVFVDAKARIGSMVENEKGVAEFILNPARQTKMTSQLENAHAVLRNTVIVDMEPFSYQHPIVDPKTGEITGYRTVEGGTESFRSITEAGMEQNKQSSHFMDKTFSDVQTPEFSEPYQRVNLRGEIETYYTSPTPTVDRFGKWVTPEGEKIVDSNIVKAKLLGDDTLVHTLEFMGEKKAKGVWAESVRIAAQQAGINVDDEQTFNWVVRQMEDKESELYNRLTRPVEVEYNGSKQTVRGLLLKDRLEFRVPDIATNQLSDLHPTLLSNGDAWLPTIKKIFGSELAEDVDLVGGNIFSALELMINQNARLGIGRASRNARIVKLFAGLLPKVK